MDTEKQEVERINNALSRANDKLDNYAYELESEVDRRTNEIYKLSNIDPLTNLSNRTAFLGMLKQKITPSQSNNIKRFLLFIDLNGFKDVNDGFGHKVGDAVLGEIALRLNGLKSIHLSDVCSVGDSSEHSIICRWGGDEFLILSTFETDSCINTLVNAIQARIQEPIHVASNNIGLGASIGIAKFPDDSSVASDLIQYADISMYHHKSINKGGAVYFSHDLLEKFQYDQIVRDGLKNALQSNEFSLVFQPIMDIKTGQPWAFEALLRWQHRNKIVSPNDFIPIAEKAGHIVKIGAWVLTTACKEAAKWNFQQSVSISVNVSALQLIDPDFLDVVKFALLESKLPANKLHLEITESVMLEKGDVVSTTLKAIADMGIHVSIDDFGTGYSSLNQLQNMSFDIIKIDRSFLQGLNQKDLTIISATKLIADEFNAKTIAEGIETQKELSTLESLGIRYIQGFFFSKPMKPEAIEDWYLHLMKNRI